MNGKSRIKMSRLILAVTALFVGHWLFADTLDHYRPAAAEPNTIRFAHFGSYQDYELWKKIINACTSTHPE